MRSQHRTANVDRIKADSVSFASVLQIGDSDQVRAFTRALAVQREAEVFFDNEGNFNAYSMFSEAIPLLPVTESFQSRTHNLNPFIKVGNIDILGVSSSSIVHLGNSRHISMEARVKHIRQLLPHGEQNGEPKHMDVNKEP
ncbi:MAG TPA: spore germination protein GerPE [Bacillus bacterium]|nr:spore germination protein GerPE [Bacillus sp. (in: firmicutes)]